MQERLIRVSNCSDCPYVQGNSATRQFPIALVTCGHPKAPAGIQLVDAEAVPPNCPLEVSPFSRYIPLGLSYGVNTRRVLTSEGLK